MICGNGSRVIERVPFRREVSRAGRFCRFCAPSDSAVPDAVMRPEKLARNTVYSGARSGWAASGHRSGRHGLLVHRFALQPVVASPAQFASSQNNKRFPNSLLNE